MNVGAYALKTGNTDGCIQVEVGGKAERPFTENGMHPIYSYFIYYYYLFAQSSIQPLYSQLFKRWE